MFTGFLFGQHPQDTCTFGQLIDLHSVQLSEDLHSVDFTWAITWADYLLGRGLQLLVSGELGDKQEK